MATTTAVPSPARPIGLLAALLGALAASCAETPGATGDLGRETATGVPVDSGTTDDVLPPDDIVGCGLRTCRTESANCGSIGDGCNGILHCGDCVAPQTCGGGGVPSRCGGTAGCVPRTCRTAGANCGPVADGCGGVLQCGACATGQTCGGGGSPSQCGSATMDGGSRCTPRTCASVNATCGPIGDGCGGVLQCGDCAAPQTCGGGGVPSRCGGMMACVPRTCASVGATCGPVADGCGRMLNCGVCPAGQACGGGGVPSVCGVPGGGPSSCTPRTCATANADCGPVSDGCGALLMCGTCSGGQICGGGGVPSRCGSGGDPDGGVRCVPRTCATANANCGPVSDGCGALLMCGTCSGGQTCGGGGVPSRCGSGGGPDAGVLCVPRTCATANANCGPVANGCGGVLACGACPAGQTCGGGGVPSRCGAPRCTPRTCASTGANCGPVSDGCGGLIQCGNCAPPQSCGGGMTPSVCGSTAPPPSCTNLCLRRATCTPGVVTTISGTVVSPARTSPDPIYNAVVYIPNAAVPAFRPGVACDRCSAGALGSPVVSARTGPDGRFVLRDVPVGANIPLVVQIGRWRRQVTLNTVNPCVDNVLTADQTRLPRNRSEGDIPLMAMVTGRVDGLECVLRKIGIDDAEFTTPSGPGRVQMYVHPTGLGRGGNIAGAPDVSALYPTAALDRYDMVLLACQGRDFDKTATAERAVLEYANRGGRVFATHYSYSWLHQIAPLSRAAGWTPNDEVWSGITGHINTTFPRGRDFAEWLRIVGATSGPDQIAIAEPRPVVASVNPPTQMWIDTRDEGPSDRRATVQHLTANMPWAGAAGTECGRVLFSAFHVNHDDPPEGRTFPGYCSNSPMTATEKVLEFMLFDLASCVEPDLPGPGRCTPRTCAALNANCGQIGDGCGGMLSCGVCPAGQTCGINTPNRCDANPCRPRTCADQGLSCGPAGNGCGAALDCGPCPLGTTCGGGGTPGVCGAPACRPITCASQGLSCGAAGDGCGRTIDCGACPPGTTCGGGGTPGRCGGPTCRPITCMAQGLECGPAGDGCGGTIQCGTCPPGYTCGGVRPGVCAPPPPCRPRTCADQSLECGPAGDGCGGLIQCGDCAPPLTCGGGGVLGRCGMRTCPTMQTCMSQGIECGPAGDGCGGTLQCGTCPPGHTCGGVRPGICAPPLACRPRTCADQGLECGPAGDGCGRQIECGNCEPPASCGGGGRPGVCGRGPCTPRTCRDANADCGPVADGCGGVLNCGLCVEPLTCGGGDIANRCGRAG